MHAISNTFIINARLKLAKNHANAKQNPEAEYLLLENYAYSSPTLFENYAYSSLTLSSKNNRIYS